MDNCNCDNGFACLFNFRNAPPPMKHVRLKLSNFHSRVSDLFETFPDIDKKFLVDNLRTSANFSE